MKTDALKLRTALHECADILADALTGAPTHSPRVKMTGPKPRKQRAKVIAPVDELSYQRAKKALEQAS